jgi:hypothetical protein
MSLDDKKFFLVPQKGLINFEKDQALLRKKNDQAFLETLERKESEFSTKISTTTAESVAKVLWHRINYE